MGKKIGARAKPVIRSQCECPISSRGVDRSSGPCRVCGLWVPAVGAAAIKEARERVDEMCDRVSNFSGSIFEAESVLQDLYEAEDALRALVKL
ncbi:MAG: hypothetical protein QUS11_06620 [Candidatus Fermentibacter sp.]|nr:hypothetical protein [Candidatus Fermentibacter sp.]